MVLVLYWPLCLHWALCYLCTKGAYLCEFRTRYIRNNHTCCLAQREFFGVLLPVQFKNSKISSLKFGKGPNYYSYATFHDSGLGLQRLFNETSFELPMETISMLRIFAVLLCYLSSHERRPERGSNPNLCDAGAARNQLNYVRAYD